MRHRDPLAAEEQLLPPEVAYPPAPWQARGQVWVGLFRADAPAVLPPGLVPVLGSRLRCVALVRYQAGSTLVYDELMVGTFVRTGLRPGLYIEHIYVDSVASLWGGRRIWGLPKELATFTWDAASCRVADAAGTIATLRVDRRPSRLPPLPAALAGIGQLGGIFAYFTAPLTIRLARPGFRIEEWSSRYPYRLRPAPVFAFSARPYRMSVHAPKLLRPSARP